MRVPVTGLKAGAAELPAAETGDEAILLEDGWKRDEDGAGIMVGDTAPALVEAVWYAAACD